MDRRQFLTAARLGPLAVGAGCVGAPRLGDDTPSHPLAGGTTRVTVRNRSTTDHDVERNAWEALTFWEANDYEFLEFEFAFELVESDPDLVVSYEDTPAGCRDVDGYSELVMGCAPLVRADTEPQTPIPITVVAGNRPYGEIKITAQHEVGHTLGLGHDDEPRRVMSNQPEDRIPLYDTRVAIWDQVVAAQTESAEAIDRFDAGSDAWENHDYTGASGLFEEAYQRFEDARALFADGQQQTTAFEREGSTETVDLTGLRDRLDRIGQRLDLAVSFAELMSKAAAAAAKEDHQRANSYRRDANDDIRAFNEVEPPQIREIAVALGLVRGRNRDGTVVDDRAFGYGRR